MAEASGPVQVEEYRREMLLRGLDEIGQTLLDEPPHRRLRAPAALPERSEVMKEFTIAVLPGDGIGPEVTAEAVRVLTAVADLYGYRITTAEYAIGAAGVAEAGEALPARTRDAVVESDAVLLGAVGSPALAKATGDQRPEAGSAGASKAPGCVRQSAAGGGPPGSAPRVAPPGPSDWTEWISSSSGSSPEVSTMVSPRSGMSRSAVNTLRYDHRRRSSG